MCACVSVYASISRALTIDKRVCQLSMFEYISEFNPSTHVKTFNNLAWHCVFVFLHYMFMYVYVFSFSLHTGDLIVNYHSSCQDLLSPRGPTYVLNGENVISGVLI